MQAARISDHVAVPTDDAVTGQDDRDGIAADRTADRLGCHARYAALAGNVLGNTAVGRDRAVGKVEQL